MVSELQLTHSYFTLYLYNMTYLETEKHDIAVICLIIFGERYIGGFIVINPTELFLKQ